MVAGWVCILGRVVAELLLSQGCGLGAVPRKGGDDEGLGKDPARTRA